MLKPIKKKKKISGRAGFSVLKKLFFIFGGLVALFITGFFIWASTIDLPDFNDFENRVVAKSTRIYDKSGTILLYDLHKDIKRTVIPFSDMGENIKKATIALEDDKFYSHIGIRPLSILRATIANIRHGGNVQGGSTITQQIVKNTLLTQEKTLKRKFKEWILAVKIDQRLSKDKILEIYLNESPYGGTIYGVEEASQTYFGKPAKDLTLAEAAYVASIPQRPTFYLPYGKNTERLLVRKDYALQRMLDLKMITQSEYTQAKSQQIVLASKENSKGIRAPHFVFFIQDYLIDTYGEDVVSQGGLKVITTLDYDIQKKAEEVVYKNAIENKKNGAENMGMVGIDPRNGQIVFMVGSRDYFDTEIDGAYNIATAQRQPGSSFKPLVYALAFEKGYLPETVLFDIPMEFNSNCNINHVPLAPGVQCYSPKNYLGNFNGAVTIRKALAGSLNIPAVKMLYLVGPENAIRFAKDLGISTLGSANRYGLSLVLGGAEVRLIDMVGAYSTFATGGLYRKPTGILSVTDASGKKLEEYKDNPGERIMSENSASKISSILSDNDARTYMFGPSSKLYIPGRNVAVKTGTTNDVRDAWVIGYTQTLTIGAWAGNNDNRPMAQKSASMIAAPAWREMFDYILTEKGNQYNDPAFKEPTVEEDYESINPALKGLLATNNTHSELYYINKNDPRGAAPTNPSNDSQFINWESAVRNYFGYSEETTQGVQTLCPNGMTAESNCVTPPTTETNINTTTNTDDHGVIPTPYPTTTNTVNQP